MLRKAGAPALNQFWLLLGHAQHSLSTWLELCKTLVEEEVVKQALVHLLAAFGVANRTDLLVELSERNLAFDDAFWRIVLDEPGADEVIRRACIEYGYVPENASVGEAMALFSAENKMKLVYKTIPDFKRFLPVVVGEQEPVPELLREWILSGRYRSRMPAEQQLWLETWFAGRLAGQPSSEH